MSIAPLGSRNTTTDQSRRSRTARTPDGETLSSWRRGRPRDRWGTSREALADAVATDLERLADLPPRWDGASAPASRAAAFLAAGRLVGTLVFDDGPAPHITPDGDGGVSLSWWIAGTSIHLQVDADLDVLLWATSPSGEVLFESESPAHRPDLAALGSARVLLVDLSRALPGTAAITRAEGGRVTEPR